MKTFSHPIHILIDGPDKVGKTTVIKMLSDQLNIPVIKMTNMKDYLTGSLSENKAEEFSKLFNETLIQFKDSSFIMDRGFTSSIVYSRVFNRSFDLSYLDDIEQILQPKVFILTGTRFDDDDVYSNAQMEIVNAEFCNLALERGYNLVSNTRKTPFGVVVEIINSL